MVAESVDCIRSEIELYATVGDGRYALRRHVLRLPEHPARDREAVEDVLAGIADELLDSPDLGSVGGDHDPPRLDHEPGDRLVGQTGLPSTYQTGPWVETDFVSDCASKICSRPLSPASSSRARQRRTISGDAP